MRLSCNRLIQKVKGGAKCTSESVRETFPFQIDAAINKSRKPKKSLELIHPRNHSTNPRYTIEAAHNAQYQMQLTHLP
jgi:hypothetical protein